MLRNVYGASFVCNKSSQKKIRTHERSYMIKQPQFSFADSRIFKEFQNFYKFFLYTFYVNDVSRIA